jgi:hypothetical protein
MDTLELMPGRLMRVLFSSNSSLSSYASAYSSALPDLSACSRLRTPCTAEKVRLQPIQATGAKIRTALLRSMLNDTCIHEGTQRLPDLEACIARQWLMPGSQCPLHHAFSGRHCLRSWEHYNGHLGGYREQPLSAVGIVSCGGHLVQVWEAPLKVAYGIQPCTQACMASSTLGFLPCLLLSRCWRTCPGAGASKSMASRGMSSTRPALLKISHGASHALCLMHECKVAQQLLASF